MELQKALKEVREQKIAPMYLLIGTELYLTELFKATLMKELLTEEDDQFNFFSFGTGETPLSATIAEAETTLFFGDYRLVFVENPYPLTAERKTNGVEHDVNLLLNYLESPSPATVLVFMVSYGKLDEYKKIAKALKKNAVVVDVSPMNEKAIRQYISQTIESERYTIRSDASDLLLQLIDLNLLEIMGELQKLYLYALETKVITRGMVQELVPKSLEHNVSDLINEILSGNSEKAVRLYEDLLLQGEETIKLDAVLLNRIRLLLRAKILARMGYQRANIADTLKAHPYRVKLALQQVRRPELSRLGRLYDELVENDYRMRTGQMDKELLFQLFILKLTAQAK